MSCDVARAVASFGSVSSNSLLSIIPVQKRDIPAENHASSLFCCQTVHHFVP